ncbi:MAG: preprotein translocase subunit SecG [Candidatus Latescibacteria bacterium]|jgi:preprotein translocase subunit SecG|nr:preprotein translocase subunit SecG [Candidatus Latescibacterota bacterium]
MSSFVTIVHVLVCVVLIISVLLQSGKGGGMSSAFGGGGGGGGGGAGGGMSSQMFGGRGAGSFLGKVTAVAAVLYMVLVIGLNLLPDEVQGPRSLIQDEALKNQQASPAQGLPTVPVDGATAVPATPVDSPAPAEGAGEANPQ